MNIKALKASVQLAQMRFNTDPSEANQQILDAAMEAYEYALDPEKKTEDLGDHQELDKSDQSKKTLPASATIQSESTQSQTAPAVPTQNDPEIPPTQELPPVTVKADLPKEKKAAQTPKKGPKATDGQKEILPS